MNKNSFLKPILIKHFDNKDESSFNSYGSDTLISSLRAPYKFLEDFLKSNELEGKRVLDYCCGSGVYSILPAKLGAEVTGIDFSKNSIKNAKTRAKNCGVADACKFYSEDVEEMTFNSGKYDFILLIDSLLYLDMNKTFIKLSEMLKDDGEFILIEGMGSNFFFNLNRKRNISNYASGFEEELTKKTIEEISKSFENIFFLKKDFYFGFTSTFAYILEEKFKVKIDDKVFVFFDDLIRRIYFMKKYFFRCLLILKKNDFS